MRPGSLLRAIVVPPYVDRNLVAGSVVVDIGGFDGLIGQRLLRHRPTRLVVVDIDDAALREARRRGLYAVRGSATALPIRSGSVDLILCLDVIEHVENDVGVLSEVSRSLRARGRLIMTTPSIEFGLPFVPRHRLNRAWGHLRNGYAKADLVRALDDCGLALLTGGRYFGWVARLLYAVFFVHGIPPRLFRAKTAVFGLAAKMESICGSSGQEHILVAEKRDRNERR